MENYLLVYRIENLQKNGAFQVLPLHYIDDPIFSPPHLPPSVYRTDLPTHHKYACTSLDQLRAFFPYESINILMEHDLYLTTYKILTSSSILHIDDYQIIYIPDHCSSITVECPSTLYSY